MPPHSSSAARTNLTSNDVRISNYKLGEGVFRVCLEGDYVGGTRNQQEAACKRFKPQFRHLEDEFFAVDFRIAEKCIEAAEEWNKFCPIGNEILISYGDLQHSNSGIKYLVEPLIRYFTKYTSNSGWISSSEGWQGELMEAFSHYSYHRFGGQLLICDLQGRYRHNQYNRGKCRFELTDPAICSRRRNFGPTDLGEKGIDSFFANHTCNQFCDAFWQRPRCVRQWFPLTQGTSMLSSRMSNKLLLQSKATFRLGLQGILEEEDSVTDNMEEDSDSDLDYF